MSTLAAELITTDEDLHALVPEWEALYRRVPDATPFQSPHWLLPWWHAFGTPCPCVAVLRRQDRLVALLPLYVLDDPPGQKLLPVGIGITDYLDVLLGPGLPHDAADALLRIALDGAARRGVVACDLTDIPEHSALRALQAPPGWLANWRASDPAPVLAIGNGTTGLNGAIPARMRRKLRMNWNRIAKRGDWRVEAATSASLKQILRALIHLHEARWANDDEPGVLADPAVRKFHEESAPGLLAAGMLRLCALWIGDRMAACCHALAANDRLFLYLGGYDPGFAHESPGSVLIGEMIADAIAQGCREVHFLRGGEAYKYAWGASDRRNAACHLVRA